MSVVALASGGLDSTVMVYQLRSHGYAVDLLAVDYGQRHRCELDAARSLAERIKARTDVVDLSALRPLLGGSALTDDAVAVPDGHYAEPTMAATIVPNRNAILLSVAFAAAIARGAQAVAYASHAGDHHIYPDCRPEFFYAFSEMERNAQGVENDDERRVELWAPFLHKHKSDIVTIGARLGVPFAETWSCYRGGERHCGMCGTCVERREAFRMARIQDPTEYAV